MLTGNRMGLRGLVYALVLAFTSLPLRVDGVVSYKFQQDGSVSTPKLCDCKSVEHWLPKTANGASNVFSYEERILKTLKNVKSLSINTYRGVHLIQFPKNCELILNENIAFHKQNIANRSVEIWFKRKRLPNCIPATVKCKLRSLCIGIQTRPEDESHSTQRKLLMFETESTENTFPYQPYSVVFGVFAFCVLVVCIALCGKAEKNSQESVARDTSGDNVEIISSEKVQTDHMPEPDHPEAKVESVEIRVESPTTDSNSNHSSPPVGVVDPPGPGKNGVDGAVFGKQKPDDDIDKTGDTGVNEDGDELRGEVRDNLEQKEGDVGDESLNEGKKRKESKKKEEKRKEKELKNKDHHKETKSKRSHSNPVESVDQKALKPKMRFSLKKNSEDLDAYEEPKVSKRDKKKSKKKSDSDQPLPSPPLPNSRALSRGDRRSLTNRELPKTPSDGPPDSPSVGPRDVDEDDYDVVQIQGGPTRPQGETKPAPDNDSNLYDSVDDREAIKSRAGGAPNPIADDDQSDAYETVDPKLKSTNPPEPIQEFYEEVRGLYDEPSVNRQRSFSEGPPGASTPRTDAQRKTMSLGRQTAPTPPPKDSSQQRVMDDIDPYTITVKKGDRIIQETNISAVADKPSSFPAQQAISDEEKEKLYTKVDKEKQKRDRAGTDKDSPSGEVEEENDTDAASGTELENDTKGDVYAQVDKKKQKRDRIESEKGATDGGVDGGVEGEGKTNGDAKMDEPAGVIVSETKKNSGADKAVPSSAVVPVEEHQYESMPRQKQSGKVLDKKDSFEETEDFEYYEEVKQQESERSGVFV